MRETSRRQVVAGTVFSTWVVLGLFLDGWAHNAGKPEDFWTPWHAVLYSGFAAAVLWSAIDRVRHRRRGEEADIDPLILLGFVAFGIAGVGDGVWHTIFGVEEDVAALLSPTHLGLMIGGLLLITGPLRRDEDTSVREGWRRTYPSVVAVTLATAVLAFFLQFASPFHIPDPQHYAPTGSEDDHVLGVVAILLTNALLLSAAAWAIGRRRLPAGGGTAIVGGTALLMAGLGGFARIELVAAAAAAGVALDAAHAMGARRRTVLLVLPGVLWPAWFAIHHLRWGLGWAAEYWTGTVVLTVLTAAGVDLLVSTRDVGEPAAPTAAPAGAVPEAELAVTPAD